MKMVIRISKCTDAGYAAWCPALPGCAVRARSRDEAQERIKDAIVGYLSILNVALPRELSQRFAEEPAPGAA